VRVSNCDPCQRHCTVPPIITPPASDPPRCVQLSSNAVNPSAVRATTSLRPFDAQQLHLIDGQVVRAGDDQRYPTETGSAPGAADVF
jgi:hypothetical protein